MNELLDFKRRAKQLGLCGQYSELWNKAGSRYDLMRMATDSNGAEFLCDSTAFGWGLPLDYITKNFPDYINGEQIIEHFSKESCEMYTSELYVGYGGLIQPRTTLLIILGCNCIVNVPECALTRIYVAKSNVLVGGKGTAEVIEYYDEKKDNCIVHREPNASVKVITKSGWKK